MKRGLLTGWLICSRCGGRLTGADPNNGYPRYQCQSNWYVEGGPKRHVCGLSISSLPTDTWLRHNITWRSRLTARWDPRLLRLVPTPLTETTWEALTRDEKRTHISQHLQRIIVHPHGGTGMWQESRLEPTWLTTLPPAPPFEWKTYAFDRELLSDRNRINAYEAARILDVHPSDLRRFRAKGKLVTLDRDRRRWVYSRANVEEFAELRSQERKARAEKRI